MRAASTLRLSENGFLLSSSWKFPIFLFSLDLNRMQSLERIHQHEQAEPSSHQKSWRLRAVFGRLESFTRRPTESSGLYHRRFHSPPRTSCEGKSRKQHLNNELRAIWATLISGECERLDKVKEATVSKGYLIKGYKVKSRKQRMELRSKLRKKAIRSRSNSNILL